MIGHPNTAVSSEAWAKLRDWASVAGRGRLLLSGSLTHASLKTAVLNHTKKMRKMGFASIYKNSVIGSIQKKEPIP